MPSLRKRSRSDKRTTWDIRYQVNGKARVYTIGETDRRTAERIYRDFCDLLAVGRLDKLPLRPLEGFQRLDLDNGGNAGLAESPRSRILSDLFDHAAEYSKHNKSPKTSERESTAFQRLLEGIGDIPLVELSVEVLEKYKAQRLKTVSKSTVNIEIRMLNAAIHQAAEQGWTGLPTKGFKLLRQIDKEPPKWLSREQIKTLLATATGDYRRFIEFCLNTGCRRNEVLEMRWDNIDLERRQLVVIGKMGKRRTIPINDELSKMLQEWPGRHIGLLFTKFNPNQISMAFKRIREQAGLPSGISVHSLRATFASHLIEQGVDIYTVSRLLGHSSVTVTEKHYLALDPAHAKVAVDTLRLTGPPDCSSHE